MEPLKDAVKKPFKKLAKHEPLWTEFWSGIASMMWALWQMTGSPSLDTISNYRYLTSIMSDQGWTVLAFFFGLFQVWSVLKDWKVGRLLAAFVASTFWGVLGYGIFLGSPAFPGASLYLIQGMVANMMTIYLLSVSKFHEPG